MDRATWAFVARRLITLVVTLFVASVLIYGSFALAPGDPATLLVGGSKPNPETLAAIRAEYHLDDPVWVQYGHWLHGFVTGDLGRSMVYRSDVTALLGARVVNSLFLVAYAGALIVLAGVGLGLLAALSRRSVDRAVTVGTSVAMASPTFVTAILLIWLFATQVSWLPVFGSGTGFLGRLEHLTLPAIALALSYLAYVARVSRTAVRAELASEHVDTATARGLPRRTIVRRHVLRNAAAPILTVSGIMLAGLFAGTAIAEQAFGVNGLGSLLVDSAAKQDMAVVMAISMFLVTAFVVVNTVVDVVTAALDPRIAPGGRS
ncbi:UNVERIFIED_CONTAM: ABC transporter permease [Mumia flava]